jgi:hypothetical protein
VGAIGALTTGSEELKDHSFVLFCFPVAQNGAVKGKPI